MKKTLKSLVSIILILVTVFGMTTLAVPEDGVHFGLTANAATKSGTCGANGDNLTWTLDDDGTLTISGTGKMKDYGSTNTPWYSDRKNITRIVIRPGVTYVGNHSFSLSDNLLSVEIPSSVISIGQSAFIFCGKLTDVEIPCEIIGTDAFSWCGLRNVVLRDSVKEIGSNAFSNTAIRTIHIPASVEVMQSSFNDVSEYDVDKNNAVYCDVDGVLFSKDKKTLIDYPRGNKASSYEIPGFAEIIGDGAFSHCDNLTEIKIPDSIVKIGDSAFFGVKSLKEIYVPDSVKQIGLQFICESPSIERVRLPSGLKRIEESSFIRCYNLKAITIPNSVIYIGKYAFDECTGLEEIFISDGVRTIDFCAFRRCSNLKKVELGRSVSTIMVGAFCYCSSLSSITIPESVTEIKGKVFEDCRVLQKVAILNPKCKIASDNPGYPFPTKTEIYGYKGSTAERYAKIFGNPFFTLDTPKSVSRFLKDDSYTVTVVDNENNPVYDATVSVGGDSVQTDENGTAVLYGIYDKTGVISVKSLNYADYVIDNYTFKSTRSDVIKIGQPVISAVVFSLPREKVDVLREKRTFDVKYGSTPITISVTPSNGASLEYIRLVEKKAGSDWQIPAGGVSSQAVTTPWYQKYSVGEIQSDGKIKLDFKDLSFGSEYYIYAQDAKTKSQYRARLLIEVTNSNDFDSKLTLGGKSLINLNGACKGLFDFSIGLPELYMPLEFCIADDTIFMAYNLLDTEGNSILKRFNDSADNHSLNYSSDNIEKALKKGWKDASEKYNKNIDKNGKFKKPKNTQKPEDDASFQFNSMLYMQGKIVNGKIPEVSGKLAIELSAGLSHESPFLLLGTVPCIAEFGFSASIGADWTTTITSFKPLNMEAELLLSGKVNIEVGVGLGVPKAGSIGFYGGGELSADYLAYSQKPESVLGLQKAVLEFYLGVKMKIAMLTMKYEFPRASILLYDVNASKSSSTVPKSPVFANSAATGTVPKSPMLANSASNASASAEPETDIYEEMYDLSEYEPISREYLDDRSAWTGEKNIKADNSGSEKPRLFAAAPKLAKFSAEENLREIEVLQSSAYTGIVPQVVNCGGTTMLVFENDIAERADNDRYAAVYSLYNAATSSWSAPVVIADDGTADFSPVLYSDGSRIWAVWQNAADLIPDDADFNDVYSSLELCAAYYDTASGEWSVPMTVTSNSKYESMHCITSADGKVYIAWTVNADGDIFGQNSSNIIKYSVFENGEWSEETEIVSGIDTVTDMSIGVLNGTVYAAACLDDDCDLTTIDDTDVVLYTLDGSAFAVTDDEYSEGGLRFADFNGTDILTWISGGNMYAISDAEAEPSALINEEYAWLDASAKMITADDAAMILYTQNRDDASQIYTATYDSAAGEWGSPVAITNQEYYLENADAAYVNGQLVTVFDRVDVEITEDELNETYDLCWLKNAPQMDIAISDPYIDYDTITPGGEITVDLYADNIGDLTADSLTTVLTDSEQNIISEGAVEQTIKSGEYEVITAKLTVPTQITEEEYTLTITADGEKNTDDNSVAIRFGYADFSITTDKVTINNADVALVTVTNDGWISSDGTLKLYKQDGTELLCEDVPELMRGETAQYTFAIPNDYYFDEGKENDIMTAETAASHEECCDTNNSGKVVIDKHHYYVQSVSLPESAATYVGGSTTYTAEIIPAKAENKNVIWQSSDESIAKIDANGVVSGISAGTVTITAITEDGGLTAVSELTVEPVEIELEKDSLELEISEYCSVPVTVSPDYAKVEYSSSNTEVATVSATGTVTAVGAGTAVITVTVGNESVTCTVEVTAPIVLTGVEIASLPTKQIYTVGDEFDGTEMKIIAVYSDESFEEITEYTVTGFDSSVAGIVTVTVTYGDFTDSFDVTINERTYSVTYDANGGSNAPVAQTKTHGADMYITTDKPTWDGHTFTVWNTQADGKGTTYASGAAYAEDAEVTLYAQWTIDTFTVAYDANEGTNAPSAQLKTYGEALMLTSAEPTRDGYTFSGWNTQADGSGTAYAASASYTENAAVTLYAEWTINTFTVAYDANGGTNAPSAQTKTYGSDLTLTSAEPSRDGYTFIDWNTQADGTGIAYAAGSSYTENAAVTLYAQWSINTFTVAYDANEGTNAPSAQTKTYGEALTLTSAEPTRDGYTFSGWNTQADGMGTAYAAGSEYTVNENTTLFAQWAEIPVIPDTYEISYNANGGTGAPDTQTKTEDVALALSTTEPARTGYSFIGWNTQADGSGTSYASGGSYIENASITLYAQWKLNTFAVRYNANGGTNAPTEQTKEYGIPLVLTGSIPSREGYSFTGWNTSETGSGSSYASGAQYDSNAEITLYAQWKINTYTVSYDANKGENAPSQQIKTYGVSLELTSADPTRTGYSFTGWNTKADGSGEKYISGSSYTANIPVVLYAQWNINSYQIKFDANGGSGAPESQAKVYNTALTLSSIIPVRDGYAFTGWNTQADGKGKAYAPGASFTANDRATLYAQWEVTKYTVSFDANGGMNAPAAQTKIYGKDLTLTTAVPIRDGYTFTGWNTQADGKGKAYAPGASFTANDMATLYAQWNKNTTTSTTASTTASTTKSTTKSTTASTTKSTTKPTTASTTKSTTKSTTASTTKSTTKSTTASTTKSTTKSTTASTTKSTTKATTASTTKSSTKPTTASTTKSTTKATTAPMTKSTAKATTASTTKSTTKPTTASTTKSTTKATTASTTKSTTKATTASTTKSTTKATTASTTKSTTKATTASTTKSTTKPTTASTTKSTTKPTTASTTKSTTRATTASTTKSTTKPTTTKSTTKPTTAPTGVQLKRLAGDGRQQTAALISKEAYTTADNVFIASGDNAADALAGVPLASAMNAPILLIRPAAGLDKDTKAEIQRLKAKNVYILGGEGAIPAKVEKDIQALGCKTTRIAGNDRFGTAVEIANKLKSIKGSPKEVFFVYSHNYPDALAVSGVAAAKGAPILYVYSDGDIRSGKDFMSSSKTITKAYIVGGYAAIDKAADTNIGKYASVQRVYGNNRYLTCGEINKTFAGTLSGNAVCIATGTNFPDALAGGVLAAKTKSPMLLVGTSLLDYQSAYVKSKKPNTIYVFGGTNAVSDQIANDALKAAKQ